MRNTPKKGPAGASELGTKCCVGGTCETIALSVDDDHYCAYDLRCEFDGVSVDASHDGDAGVKCTAPATAAAVNAPFDVPLRVSYNGQQYTHAATYTYYATPPANGARAAGNGGGRVTTLDMPLLFQIRHLHTSSSTVSSHRN